MSTIFITGGNGFLGATIINQLLISGKHKILAAVRNPASLDKLLSIHPEWDKSLIAGVTIADFTKPDAFDSTFQSYPEIEHIIHCAAPPVGNVHNTDYVEHFEKPNVIGNIGLLRAVHRYGKKVKSIAVTGSINAITTGSQDDLKSRVIDSKQWLPYGREEAIKRKDQYLSYRVGKKVAEEAIWKFVETEKPSFTVTVFLPPLIYGPMYQYVENIQKLNFSDGQLYSIMNSAANGNGTVPNTTFPGYIDVRDLATLHIQSLTNPSAANMRFIVGHPTKHDDLAEAFRRIPAVAARVGKNNNEDIQLARIDSSDTDRVFGLKWRTLDDIAQGTVETFLKLEMTG